MKFPYIKGWDDGDTVESIESAYRAPGSLKGAKVLFAVYSYECYSGSSIVIFQRDGKTFIDEGGHCSCYGLENSWEPVEITVPQLKDKGRPYHVDDDVWEDFKKSVRSPRQRRLLP